MTDYMHPVFIQFYEGNKFRFQDQMPFIPRVGEFIVRGYGSDYRVWKIERVNYHQDTDDTTHRTEWNIKCGVVRHMP